MRALIFCAGYGKRLLPFTNTLAKPAIPLLGIPSLCYPLFLAETFPLSHLTINLHHLPDTVKFAAEKNISHSYKTHYSLESPTILESAGGMKFAEKWLIGNDNFMTLNGDFFCAFDSLDPLKSAWEQHLTSQPLCTLIVEKHDRAGTSHGGIYVNPKTKTVNHFSRQGSSSDFSAYHYMGIAFFSDRIFDWIPDCNPRNILYDTLTRALENGERVEIAPISNAQWLETGNQQDFLAASKMAVENIKTQNQYHLYLSQIFHRFSPGWSVDSLLQKLNPFETLFYK